MFEPILDKLKSMFVRMTADDIELATGDDEWLLTD